MAARVIFHIDMNCYFASVELAEDESLTGLPVAVAHLTLDKKGIILSATYEARAKGVRAAMPLFEAFKLCPDLKVVEPHYDMYSEYSRKFFEYFQTITPLVEPASIDEGYLDVTDACPDLDYVGLALKIQNELKEVYHLPCSIGIGPNKFLAKMGSDMKKPLGITIVRKRDVAKLLWPLPIQDMFGAGKKTCEVLTQLGIFHIGDLITFKDQTLLKSMLGELSYKSLLEHANGEGDNVVDPTRYNTATSISNSTTFEKDEYDVKNVIYLMKYLATSVATRLENEEMKAKTFTLQLKFNDYKTVSKASSVTIATNSTLVIIPLLQELFDELYDGTKAVRLVGVQATKLVQAKEDTKQLSIFDSLDKEAQDLEVSKAIKEINQILGTKALVKGITNLQKNNGMDHYDFEKRHPLLKDKE